MELNEQHITMHRFSTRPSVVTLREQGNTFGWSATRPEGYVRYHEVKDGKRVCFKNAKLKAYISAGKGL